MVVVKKWVEVGKNWGSCPKRAVVALVGENQMVKWAVVSENGLLLLKNGWRRVKTSGGS